MSVGWERAEIVLSRTDFCGIMVCGTAGGAASVVGGVMVTVGVIGVGAVDDGTIPVLICILALETTGASC